MRGHSGTLSTRWLIAGRHSVCWMLLVALLAATMLGVTVTLDADASSDPGGGAMTMAAQEAGATPVGATPVAANVCEASAPGVGSEPWIRSELYFGTTMPDGTVVSADEWQAFLDEEITPRFPAGLTVLEGYGQFLNAEGVIAAEDSIVLIIFHPADTVAESSASLEEIRDAYEQQFDQESVLRADSAPVCISF